MNRREGPSARVDHSARAVSRAHAGATLRGGQEKTRIRRLKLRLRASDQSLWLRLLLTQRVRRGRRELQLRRGGACRVGQLCLVPEGGRGRRREHKRLTWLLMTVMM